MPNDIKFKDNGPKLTDITLRQFYKAQLAAGWLAMCADPEVDACPDAPSLAISVGRYADALIEEDRKSGLLP